MSDECKASPFVVEDDWPSDRASYELLDMVGIGAFAKVYKARCIPKDAIVAVKILELEKVGSGIEEVRTEVATMKMCKHPNVLPCYCCFSDEATLWVVMPFMDRGSCFHVLSALKKAGRIKDGEGLPEDLIAIILREAVQGLAYLHKNGHIHRDIKAGNILLDSRGSVVIADFGVSGWLMEKGDRRREAETFVGTPCWMAPEVMEQLGGYDMMADIWSVGITALELAKGFAPYAKYHPITVMLKTLQEDPPSLRSYPAVAGQRFSRHFKEVVQLCLQRDPPRRPTCNVLLSKRFLSNAGKCDKLAAFLADVPELREITGQRLAGMARVEVDVAKAGVTVTTNGEQERVPGTTWDWGSMVMSRGTDGGAKETEDVTIDQLASVLNTGEYNDAGTPAATDAPAAAVDGVAAASAASDAVAAAPVATEPPVAAVPVAAAPVDSAPVAAEPVAAAPVDAAS